MRVVLDTNVLVSAFVFPGGSPETVYRLALQGRLQLVTSRELLLELGRVLSEKLGRPREAAAALLQLAQLAEVVQPTRRVHVAKEDPADDRVLEAAFEGGAPFVVSGDRHLTAIREWKGIRIVSPADLLVELEQP